MATTSKGLVLIVDDEPDILQSMAALIHAQNPNVRVLTASSGADGLALMRQGPLRLALIDYKMPKMNGLQFMVEARKIQPNLPVIMMTAYSDPVLAATAVRDYGVALFVAKPFDLNFFGQVLKSLLAEPPKEGEAGAVREP